MTEERVIREIRIDEVAGRGDSDSRMTSFEVIIPLKLQSTKILIYSILDIKSVLHYTISMNNTKCPIVRSVALYRLVIRENDRMTCCDRGKMAGWSLNALILFDKKNLSFSQL